MNNPFLAAEIYDQSERLSLFLLEHREQIDGSTKLDLIERWKRLRDYSSRIERPHSGRDLMLAQTELSETVQLLAEIGKSFVESCSIAFNTAAMEPPET